LCDSVQLTTVALQSSRDLCHTASTVTLKYTNDMFDVNHPSLSEDAPSLPLLSGFPVNRDAQALRNEKNGVYTKVLPTSLDCLLLFFDDKDSLYSR